MAHPRGSLLRHRQVEQGLGQQTTKHSDAQGKRLPCFQPRELWPVAAEAVLSTERLAGAARLASAMSAAREEVGVGPLLHPDA